MTVKCCSSSNICLFDNCLSVQLINEKKLVFQNTFEYNKTGISNQGTRFNHQFVRKKQLFLNS